MNDTTATLGIQIAIANLKQKVISLGFDFPSQDPETATIAELESFLEELKEFLAQA